MSSTLNSVSWQSKNKISEADGKVIKSVFIPNVGWSSQVNMKLITNLIAFEFFCFLLLLIFFDNIPTSAFVHKTLVIPKKY